MAMMERPQVNETSGGKTWEHRFEKFCLKVFVPDNDPLLFYKSIAPYAVQSLERGGRLYLEINQRFGNEVKRLLQDNGFEEVRIVEDSYGKVRFATAVNR